MRNLALVCIASLCLFSAATAVRAQESGEDLSPFTLAERIGGPNERSFFLFSTMAGNYVVRHDGMGEFGSRSGMRRVFKVKAGLHSRIHRLYFFEYQGDLLLLYEASDSGYLLRMDQTKRKLKWIKAIDSNFTPPAMQERQLTFSDGTVVQL